MEPYPAMVIRMCALLARCDAGAEGTAPFCWMACGTSMALGEARQR